MLSREIIHETDRLLREGKLSQRKISVRLGISRATVSDIASGRRGLYGREPDNERPVVRTGLPTARCPRCGYRVYMPCLICRAREHRLIRQRLATTVHAQAVSPARR